MIRKNKHEKIMDEGNKTKEGRLKLEKISTYQDHASFSRTNMIFYSLYAIIDSLVIQLNAHYTKDIIIKSIIFTFFSLCEFKNILFTTLSAYDLVESRKSAKEIEEDILNPTVLK